MTSKPSAINIPLGPLPPLDALMGKNSAKSYKGLTLLTGPTGSGKSHAIANAIYNASNPLLTLPEGEMGWQVNTAEREERREITARLQELLATKFTEHDDRAIREVFQRSATPGTMNALRFCEHYLAMGGDINELAKVGRVILPLRVSLNRVTASNIDDVTRVSVALHDSSYPPLTVSFLTELAFEYEGRGAEIAAAILDRKMVRAVDIESLLKESTTTHPVVKNGVL